MGGLVDGFIWGIAPPQHFATGGMVEAAAIGGRGTAVHVHIGGESFGPMITDRAIAEGLTAQFVQRDTIFLSTIAKPE